MFPYLNFCIQDEWIVNLLFYVIFFSCADLRNFGPSLFLQFKKFYFQTLRQNSEARNQLTSHDWRHMTGVKPSKRSYILIVMNSDEHTSLQLSLIRDFFNISHNAKPAYIDIQPCVVVERSIPVSSVQHSWSLNNFWLKLSNSYQQISWQEPEVTDFVVKGNMTRNGLPFFRLHLSGQWTCWKCIVETVYTFCEMKTCPVFERCSYLGSIL